MARRRRSAAQCTVDGHRLRNALHLSTPTLRRLRHGRALALMRSHYSPPFISPLLSRACQLASVGRLPSEDFTRTVPFYSLFTLPGWILEYWSN